MPSDTFSTGMKYFSDYIEKIRLTIRLIKDERIDTLLKLIPVFCVLYLILPIDLLIGPIDDLVVIYFGLKLFINLCPQEIVYEHQQAMGKEKIHKESSTIVDTEFKED